jgi:hypothetical protein
MRAKQTGVNKNWDFFTMSMLPALGKKAITNNKKGGDVFLLRLYDDG